MKNLFLTTTLLLFTAFNLMGQGLTINAHVGYGQIKDKRASNYLTPSLTQSLIVGQTTSNSSTSQNNIRTGIAESTPFSLSVGYGDRFEIGGVFQSHLQKPTFYFPFQESDIEAYRTVLSQNAVGLYLKAIGGNYYGQGDFHYFAKVDAGKRWSKRSVMYSDLYRDRNPSVGNEIIQHKSAFYMSIGAGIGFFITDRVILEAQAKYFPVDYYENTTSLNRVNLKTIQGSVGVKVLLRKEEAEPIPLWLWQRILCRC